MKLKLSVYSCIIIVVLYSCRSHKKDTKEESICNANRINLDSVLTAAKEEILERNDSVLVFSRLNLDYDSLVFFGPYLPEDSIIKKIDCKVDSLIKIRDDERVVLLYFFCKTQDKYAYVPRDIIDFVGVNQKEIYYKNFNYNIKQR